MLCPYPDCGRPLEGLGRFCHACERYAADYRPEPTVEAAAPVKGKKPAGPVDTRLEKEIQAAVVAECKKLELGVWSLSQARASKQTEGIADLFVTGRGLCLWIETKRQTGKQSEEQVAFEKAVTLNGGFYAVVRHESEVRPLVDRCVIAVVAR